MAVIRYARTQPTKPRVLATQATLVVLMAGSLFVQLRMVPLAAADLSDTNPDVARLRIPLAVIAILGILTTQVILVCLWRLLAMASRGTVFSPDAFGYVNVIIGAAVAAALLAFVLGVILAPGEPVPPGIVLLIGGAGVIALGVALLVSVLKLLLAQAVARDLEARRLRDELDEVI